ncbi:MAG: MFS transporter [Bacteroidota bacterium]|nr:MFS transporter [Bacteroidota bacterium]
MYKDNSSRGYIYASYIGAIIVLMDLTAVNIALPSISKAYSAGMNDVSWVLMASMLTASSFALVAGRIIELVDPRRLFIYSLLGFALFTFLSFFNRSLMMLIILRFLQGFFESAIYVIGPALIRKLLPAEKRQSSYGIWMMCTGIGISMGPVIGGLMISNAGWQSIFLINIPLCLVAVWILLRSRKRMPVSRKKVRMDFPGAFLSFAFLAGGIFTLNMGTKYGWTDIRILTAIMLSIISLLVFIYHEKRILHPVFEFSLFRNPNFLLSNLGFFIYFLANVGSRFLRPFYFEQGRGYQADVSGILMMVSPLVMILVSPLAKSMSTHTGPGNLILAALFCSSFPCSCSRAGISKLLCFTW